MSEERIVIVITGVPGVGKTAVSEILAERVGGAHIDLTELAIGRGFLTGVDEERDTSVVDLERIKGFISSEIESSDRPLIIEGHFATDVVSPQSVSIVFVLRRAPWLLKEELEARGYTPIKVKENVEAELLGVCLADAMGSNEPEKVCEIDTTGRPPEETAGEILSVMEGNRGCLRGQIDWMASPEVEGLLEELDCT